MNNLKEQAWSHFTDHQPVMLATGEGEQPRVRPVTLIHHEQGFWIATGSKSAKVKQIERNPQIEFCLQFQGEGDGGYVRVAGKGEIVVDRETKKRVAEQLDFFDDYWNGVDDPDYALLRINPVEVEYMRPGEMEAQKFIVQTQ